MESLIDLILDQYLVEISESPPQEAELRIVTVGCVLCHGAGLSHVAADVPKSCSQRSRLFD